MDIELSQEQLRQLANAAELYADWKSAAVERSRLPGGLYWKVVNSTEYLYRRDSAHHTTSLGRRGPKTEAYQAETQQRIQSLEEQRQRFADQIEERASILRAARLPFIDALTGRLLVAVDTASLLGEAVLVIGTYALPAYEVEAAVRFADGLDATEDLDFSLLARDEETVRRLLLTIRQADRGFIVSPANNARLVHERLTYKIDLVSAQPVRSLPWSPAQLEGQDWLTQGRAVSATVVDARGHPVPIVAPDPRYFALHKLWLSERPDRNAAKRGKDREQGSRVLRVVRERMPQYPMGDDFIATLPPHLAPFVRT